MGSRSSYVVPCPPCPATLDPFLIPWSAAWWTDDPDWEAPANGEPVTSWRDLTGNGQDAVRADADDSHTPRFLRSSPMNRRPAIKVTSDNWALVVEALTPPMSQPNSVVAIVLCTPHPFGDYGNGAPSRWWDSENNASDRQFAGGWNPSDHAVYAGAVETVNQAPAVGVAVAATVYDGASTHQWMNGQDTVAHGNPGSFGLGNLYLGGGNGADWFEGYVAFFGVYDGDVTTDPGWETFVAQAIADYGVDLRYSWLDETLADAPDALWLLQDSDGATMTATAGPDGAYHDTAQAGWGGKADLGFAADFRPTDPGWAEVNLDLSGTHEITVAFWMVADPDDFGIILETTGGNNPGSFAVRNVGDGTWIAQADEGGANTYGQQFPAPSAGGWHHIAITMNRANPQLGQVFIDGELIASSDYLVGSPAFDQDFVNDTLRVATKDGGSLFWKGRMAGLAIWKRLLDADRIAAQYNGF